MNVRSFIQVCLLLLIVLMLNISKHYDLIQSPGLSQAFSTEASSGNEGLPEFSTEHSDDFNGIGEVAETSPADVNPAYLLSSHYNANVCSSATSVWQPPENLF